MGGTLLVYDGLPTFLSKTGFWDIMDQYKVAFAFLPTSIIDTLEKEDMVPGKMLNYMYAHYTLLQSIKIHVCEAKKKVK